MCLDGGSRISKFDIETGGKFSHVAAAFLTNALSLSLSLSLSHTLTLSHTHTHTQTHIHTITRAFKQTHT